MARITVEDCIDKFPSRFELVLVASQRARKLYSGEQPAVEIDNDKNTVIALREIADSSLSANEMKENLIQEYQTVTLSDEEEEVLELESFNEINKENNESQSYVTEAEEEMVTGAEEEMVTGAEEEMVTGAEEEMVTGAEEEMKDLLSSEDSEIKELHKTNDEVEVKVNTVSDEMQENT